MKRLSVCFAAVTLLILLAACGAARLGVSGSSADAENIPDCQNEAAPNEADQNEAADKEILPAAQITELEPGLSTVRYDGDDGFEAFLEAGGASSDAEVLSFLTEHLLFGAGGLGFGITGGGCSTISVPASDGSGYFFGRNFDWNRCGALILVSYPENGYSSISTVNTDFIKQAAYISLPDEILKTAALYAPLDGMNEKGLCVSVNMIQDSATIEQNTEKPDITTTTAVRLLLNQAATVEEAVALLEDFDMHASFGYMVHFAVADADGDAVAVEYINGEKSVIETPVLTNFYLTEGSKFGIGTRQSHTRFDILTQALESSPTMRIDQVRDALDSVSKGNFGEFESTEWSAIFDQSALTATYYHRENYTAGYSFRLLDAAGVNGAGEET